MNTSTARQPPILFTSLARSLKYTGLIVLWALVLGTTVFTWTRDGDLASLACLVAIFIGLLIALQVVLTDERRKREELLAFHSQRDPSSLPTPSASTWVPDGLEQGQPPRPAATRPSISSAPCFPCVGAGIRPGQAAGPRVDLQTARAPAALPSGTIARVVRYGSLFGERLLRPAQVIGSTQPSIPSVHAQTVKKGVYLCHTSHLFSRPSSD